MSSDPEATPPGNHADAPLRARRRPRAATPATAATSTRHCESGYTFFRRDTQVRSTADQADAAHEWVYIVYDPSKPGQPGPDRDHVRLDRAPASAASRASTSCAMTARPGRRRPGPDRRPGDRATSSSRTSPSRRRRPPRDLVGQPQRPVLLAGAAGRQRRGRQHRPSLDVYGATSTTSGASWTGKARISTVTEQPELRAVRRPDRAVRRRLPVGDSASGTGPSRRGPTGATRSRAPTRGRRPRTRTTAAPTSSSAAPSAPPTGWSGDTCPHAGGLDQNIYGAPAP